MKLSDINKNPKNPRKIKDEHLKKLMESIKRDPDFMKLRPIVIDENNIILGGNQRFSAIKKLGMKDIPDSWVVKAKDLTDEQRERFIVIDNAPDGMSGEWDFDILKSDFDLDFTSDLFDFGDVDYKKPDIGDELEIKAVDMVWFLGCIEISEYDRISDKIDEIADICHMETTVK